jgi:signal transduction histidine kinase
MDSPEEMNAGPVDPQQRIEQLERELAQARLVLEDFTYSVSHDLRASLRHVNAYLRIAREDLGDDLDPDVAGHLDTAAGAATQMGRLMDGLMALSRVGRAELHPDAVDLCALLGDIRQKLEAGIDGRDVRWQFAPDLPHVRGDLALLNQLFTGLLDNALKFSDERDVAEVSVSWTPLGPGWCDIHVQDNGVGFDASMQDRLFRVFQRLHSARAFDGIGIGLALARRIVERHGGEIRAQSEAGQGCRISFSLPLA